MMMMMAGRQRGTQSRKEAMGSRRGALIRMTAAAKSKACGKAKAKEGRSRRSRPRQSVELQRALRRFHCRRTVLATAPVDKQRQERQRPHQWKQFHQ